MTGESIVISKTGRLLNGQHRLWACDQSGRAFPCMVVFGTEDKTHALFDTGKKRTPGDVFALKGVSGASGVAAATAWLMRLNNRQELRSGVTRPSNEELYEEYSRHPGLRDSALFISKAKKIGVAPPGILIALHYLCGGKSESLADRFFEQIVSGVGFDEPDEPAFVIYQRLVDNLNKHEKLRPWHIAALIIKAWNKARRGERIKSLRWSIDEDFPVIE